jgi:hypothetical protein
MEQAKQRLVALETRSVFKAVARTLADEITVGYRHRAVGALPDGLTSEIAPHAATEREHWPQTGRRCP